MKKILLVLAVSAFVVSSCGLKSNAQAEDAKEETTVVEAAAETAVADSTDKACCEKDSTKACCEKDSVAVEETEAPAESAE